MVNLITRKPGLYTGPIPDVSKYIVPEKKSDAYLVPHNLRLIEKFPRYLARIASLSETKPVFIFNMGDFPRQQPKGNFIFLQNSIEVGSVNDVNRTVILPYNVRSISTDIRKKAEFPTVSFVGQIPALTAGRIARSLFPLSPSPITVLKPHYLKRNPALIRKLGAKQILNHGGIVIPRLFHGGSAASVQDPETNRDLYEYTMELSDLVFSPRGDANSSFRLYETFSAGRIPIVPNTSIYLPNGVTADTHELIITTSPSCLDMFQKINLWWEGMTQSDYVDRQRCLKDVFESRLKYEKYIKHIFEMDLIELSNTRPILISSSVG